MRIRKFRMAISTLITVGAYFNVPHERTRKRRLPQSRSRPRSKFRVGSCRRGPTSSREWTTTTSGMWFRSLMRTIRCCMPCSNPTPSIA